MEKEKAIIISLPLILLAFWLGVVVADIGEITCEESYIFTWKNAFNVLFCFGVMAGASFAAGRASRE